MELNTNVGQQRTMKFYIDYRIKKQKEKSDNGTTFKYFTPKPTEHLRINGKIDFELPYGLGATVAFLPLVRTAGLKSYQKTSYPEDGTISFSLNNETFTKTFKFRKKDSISAFIILIEKDNEAFNIKYHYNEGNNEKRRCRIKQYSYLKKYF